MTTAPSGLAPGLSPPDLAAAYRFWHPTVATEGLLQGLRDLGIAEGAAMAIGVAGPRHTGFTLDPGTARGLAALDLRAGAVRVELPPGPVTGHVDDRHRTRVADLAAGRSHLIRPPGDLCPEARSGTSIALLHLRVPLTGGDTGRALDTLRRVNVQRPGAQPVLFFPCVDVSALSTDGTCLRWEEGPEYWRVLRRVLAAEPRPDGPPIPPGAGRWTREARDAMLAEAYAGTRPAWPGRRWERVEPADTPGLHCLTARDSAGRLLDGGANYRLGAPPPVPEWSVTAYDRRTRSQVRTDQDRAALRSLAEPVPAGAELFFGPAPPMEYADSRWVKTVPGEGWFAHLRVHGAAGEWRPGDFERL
ncbi:hypothetical protein Afil01_17920 [Actinorhabdospora filicis]|uniref:DUF1214 domain-containing protein n=1 Tax=Actinorhabdospora filicis TaxID=1785913 RepID=A0A9W6W9U9_9ACTN|nr:DUF1214 domain-containing protein [Actinorhabdospora filicis]GLZ76985.1 hypothetical protein Afil01_17920 [Actinorhabdospora filicis]